MMMQRWSKLVIGVVGLLGLATCTRGGRDQALTALRAFEDSERARVDFASLPPSDRISGPDPYVIRPLPGTGHLLGLLRGADALVVLDDRARELQRLDAPASPTGLAVAPDGAVYVSGEHATAIARYQVSAGGLLAPTEPLELDGVLGHGVRAIRDIAVGPEGVLYAVEELRGRLLAIEPATRAVHDIAACRGPVRVVRVAGYVLTNCLLEHALVIRAVDSRGMPATEEAARVVHDGPIWAFDARVDQGELVIAAAGVEDHPLDRTGGFFGYIDSFAFLYRVRAGAPERVWAVNLSELGVITPKWIAFDGAARVRVSGYGAPGMAIIDARRGAAEETADAVPGITDMVWSGERAVAASPLFDAWVRIEPASAVSLVRLAPPRSREPRSHEPRSPELVLGEALFFTELMAPWNPAGGPRSRFTCETCHFEGYVDGRVHYTGRGAIHAATKPLLGLFNNRPHFSRALDRTLAQMVHNEFRVANATSERAPWFALTVDDVPWLAHIDGLPRRLSPELLRRALMSFLMAFTHRPNPAVLGRERLTDLERAGARVFRDRCERCHSARLSADQPATRVPFARWERLILAPRGAIVWARSEYARTGVTPYVHELGARVPSLRRLYKKWPYFTNGSAASVEEVLSRAAYRGAWFYHDDAPAGARPLSARERAALGAFLRLL